MVSVEKVEFYYIELARARTHTHTSTHGTNLCKYSFSFFWNQIWDLQKKMCVHTLEASVSPVMSLLYQPDLQILITGSKDGVVYLWSTTNCG